jgi:hypothetical protein
MPKEHLHTSSPLDLKLAFSVVLVQLMGFWNLHRHVVRHQNAMHLNSFAAGNTNSDSSARQLLIFEGDFWTCQ